MRRTHRMAVRLTHHSMTWPVLLVLLAFGGSPDRRALAQAPVDLRTWSQKGATGAGNWTVAADGSNVFQSINGAPTFFISPNDFLNTTVEGSFGVETGSDNDFMGFVFAYHAPMGTGNDIDCILFDWKQGTQSNAPAGFWLGKAFGAHNGAAGTGNELWPKTSDASITLTSFGSPLVNAGWADNTVYDFRLIYGTDRIEIYIEGGTGVFATEQKIFDVGIGDLPAGTFAGDQFPDGRFGFYNHSQQSVRYRSFTQTDDPVLLTSPADGGTLDVGPVRVAGSATADLQVTNAGGVGSTLNGSVGAANGEFSGPTPDAGFTLGPSQSATKTFAYAPTARGADSQQIAVTSDGGISTITLAGTGVGPVFGSTPTAGGPIDFGVVDKDVAHALGLTLANDTPDIGGDPLTGLTVDYQITGPDALLFDLDLGTATVISNDGELNLQVTFDPMGAEGVKTATLTILTDEDVAFGATTLGNSYSFTLTAEAVPEPATLALVGLGGLACVARRRARRN